MRVRKVPSHQIRHGTARHGMSRHRAAPRSINAVLSSSLSHWDFPYALHCTAATCFYHFLVVIISYFTILQLQQLHGIE